MSNPTQDSHLRIGVLGAGMMGEFHAALSSRVRGARLAVVNDAFGEKAQVLAAEVGARVVDDPIAAINDPEVDAVLIVTPAARHSRAHRGRLSMGAISGRPITAGCSARRPGSPQHRS